MIKTTKEFEQWLKDHKLDYTAAAELLGYKPTGLKVAAKKGTIPLHLSKHLELLDELVSLNAYRDPLDAAPLDDPLSMRPCPFCGAEMVVSNIIDDKSTIIRHLDEPGKKDREKCPLAGMAIYRPLKVWNQRDNRNAKGN